jgi:formylmethanofuran dehydrogenase subunit B
MSRPQPTASIVDATCPACGCLCDDLKAVVDSKGSVVEVHGGCPIASEWLKSMKSGAKRPAARIEGEVVPRREAVAMVADLLAEARAPVIFGLRRATIEAVRAAVELADRVKGRVVLDRSYSELGRLLAFQRRGRASATLGEVKNRADVVVFWGADPLKTHPRHWERYSVEPKGRFVPRGREGRTVIVVDARRTATAQRADVFLKVPPERDVAALTALRLAARGRTATDVDGVDMERLRDVAGRLKGARYGAFFFESRASDQDSAGDEWDSATQLVRDLNGFTRFALLGLGSPSNLAGAEAVLAWQTGFPVGVDFRSGRPVPTYDHKTLGEVLYSGAADFLLIVGDPPSKLGNEAREAYEAVRKFWVGPGATAKRDRRFLATIETTVPGFDAGGTYLRADGAPAPLSKIEKSSRPSAEDVLNEVLSWIDAGPPPGTEARR